MSTTMTGPMYKAIDALLDQLLTGWENAADLPLDGISPKRASIGDFMDGFLSVRDLRLTPL